MPGAPKFDDARPQPALGGGDTQRIAAVLTCFNRRQQTLDCLVALRVAVAKTGLSLQIIVVDDGSTDGTAAALRAQDPEITVIESGGDLFWNRGMHRGMAEAMQRPINHVLWLNDDTLLAPDALQRLLAESQAIESALGRPTIMVGATCGSDGQLTYGGSASAGKWRCLSYHRVWHASKPVACEVMNGNCVLLPANLVKQVGNLDPVFEHAMGDTDYALRARRAGFGVHVASGFVGRCANNPVHGTYSDTSLPWATRWRKVMDRKGLPWRSWFHFTRRHGGWLWPLYFAWPYCQLLVSGVFAKRSGSTGAN